MNTYLSNEQKNDRIWLMSLVNIKDKKNTILGERSELVWAVSIHMVLPPKTAEVEDEGNEVEGEKLLYGGNRIA